MSSATKTTSCSAASIDHSTVDFGSSAEVGVINPALQVQPSGFFVDTPEGTGFIATPVNLGASNTYYAAFATDTLTLTPALAVTLSGRFNHASIALSDRRGADLTGTAHYARFNPAVGATYKLAEDLTVYAGYSEGNRTPTPSEIECSNPAEPCLLPSSLSSDPPNLRQVVSHTYEAGLRGKFDLPAVLPGGFNWNAGLFRTDLDDDIYGVATSLSTGFFENIGATRRQGIETGLAYKDDDVVGLRQLQPRRCNVPIGADPERRRTTRSPTPTATSRSRPGDRLPGIPMHQLKAGADYRIRPNWIVGAALTYFSDQFLRGDESNQNPTLPGYAVVSLHTSYKITDHFELFANVQNLLDAKYASFGQFGDPTGIGAPGVPTNGVGVDNRFLAPGAPHRGRTAACASNSDPTASEPRVPDRFGVVADRAVGREPAHAGDVADAHARPIVGLPP